MRQPCVLKTYYEGGITGRPTRHVMVTDADAEYSSSGTIENDDGIITSFVCDRCKKSFKAEKACKISVEGRFEVINFRRAFCGRCYRSKEIRKLCDDLNQALANFDSGIASLIQKINEMEV